MDFIIDPQLQISLGPAQHQHAKDLMQLCKGWHKFFPFVGACLQDSLHDQTRTGNAILALQQRIIDELRNDQIQGDVTYDGAQFLIELIS